MPENHELRDLTRRMRYDVLDMTGKWGGHPSSCFSAVEIMTALFFDGILRYRPEDPGWPERDRFILSKGHAAPLLYSVLVRAGYAPVEELQRFRQRGSGLHGHPIQGTFPGVEMTSGSLGQGLSFGLGQVLAGRLSGLEYRVYVLMGDGECEEGQVWEAAMAAAPHVYEGDAPFTIGVANRVREGRDVTLIACGIMVPVSLDAAAILAVEGIEARVLDMHTLRPLDVEAIAAAARDTGAIVTAEEHLLQGGMGANVARIVTTTYPVPMRTVGIQDRYAGSASPFELMEDLGLTPDDVAAAAREAVAAKTRLAC